MSDADFDIIVVGSGCAGAVAAYVAASAGKSVLVVERGNYAGAKNMTGGRIYSHSLKEVFPDFESEAPLERKITHERIAMLNSDSEMTIDFTSPVLAEEGKDSYSVLRGPFDQWLAEKAEGAGAEYICGIAVEELLKDESGKVVGIRAGEDEITSQVVIVAEGTNTLLSERCLGNARPAPCQMAVGIKEVFELPAGVIEDRFLLPEGEGAAMLFVGDCTHGKVGGGFLYTNRDSISLGLVATISTAAGGGNDTPVYQMLEDFKGHPAVAPIIRGAKMVEHSGHMVPEGGINIMPPLVGDGVLLAGESAMMCINLGYQVRGMDYAVAAGMHAGREAARAIDAGDTSAEGLSSYVAALEASFVLRDLRQYRKVPAFMEGFTRMFDGYPQTVRDLMNGMFVVDGEPMPPMKKQVTGALKSVGVMNLVKDARGVMKAL